MVFLQSDTSDVSSNSPNQQNTLHTAHIYYAYLWCVLFYASVNTRTSGKFFDTRSRCDPWWKDGKILLASTDIGLNSHRVFWDKGDFPKRQHILMLVNAENICIALFKNPTYGRQRICWPMRIVGPIQFWRGCVIYLKNKIKKLIKKNIF